MCIFICHGGWIVCPERIFWKHQTKTNFKIQWIKARFTTLRTNFLYFDYNFGILLHFRWSWTNTLKLCKVRSWKAFSGFQLSKCEDLYVYKSMRNFVKSNDVGHRWSAAPFKWQIEVESGNSKSQVFPRIRYRLYPFEKRVMEKVLTALNEIRQRFGSLGGVARWIFAIH